MIATVRSEWIKLRTVRGTWVLLAVALLFPTLLAGLLAALGSVDDLTAENLFSMVGFGGVVATMLLGVVGATAITNEYAFNTIRPTFAATPGRARVLAAKAVVLAVLSGVVASVMTAVALIVSGAVASSRDAAADFGTLDEFEVATAGFVVFAVLVTLFGFVLGVLLRSTPAAVAVLILWPLVVEGLVGTLLGAVGVDSASTWLPYRAATDLWSVQPVTSDLGRVGGGLLFAAAVLVLGLVGLVLTRRRDA